MTRAWSRWATALAAVVMVIIPASAGEATTAAKDEAARLLQAAGAGGGIVSHVGCGKGGLTAALHADDRYLVHGLDTGAAQVDAARTHIDSLGLYGRVSADTYDGTHLPYGDNVVNLLVVEDPAKVPGAEAARVLVPGGTAVVRDGADWKAGAALEKRDGPAGWKAYVKPRPDAIDDWTHFLYDASGNAVTRDTKVGRPRHMQWFAGPRHSRHHDALSSLSAMTSSGGRLFYIFDEGATSMMHRPARWRLVARDAFNGKLLWKRPIPEWMTHLYNFRGGPTELPRRLVSVGDDVFVTLGLVAPTVRLDAATGETEYTYAGSEGTEELIYHDGTLLAVLGDPSIHMERADGCYGYWEMAEDEQPAGPKAIVAYDAAGGKERWRRDGKDVRYVVPLSLCARGDNVFYLDGERLHCLDAKTGKPRWASPLATPGLLIRSYAPTVVAHDDVLLVLTWNRMCAHAIDTGKQLWETKGAMGFGSPADLFAIGDVAWTFPMVKSMWRGSKVNADGIPTTGIKVPLTEFINDAKTGVGVNVHTGEVADTLPFARTQHHHRCHRNKASTTYFFIGHSGIQVVDPKTKTHETNRWVRGMCQYGIMPANGYHYVPPDTCQCYNVAKINGFFALSEACSRGALDAEPTVETGPAAAEVAKRRALPGLKQAVATDWPTYRRDNARSGATAAEAPADPKPAWRAEVGATLTAPVVAGGRLYVADRDAYTVHCLSVDTGKPIWKFLAGGPIDSPPTIYRELCVFGCGDGSVYCLDAPTGRLAWRFKTPAAERRIGYDDRLASPLPIHGSVLVEDGVVYFAAGYSSNLDGGIRLYGADVWTGALKHEGRIASGHWGDDGTWGFLSDILASDGEHVTMRGTRLTKALAAAPARGKAFLVASKGLLDGTWFHRQDWRGGGARGQLLALGDGVTYSVVSPYTGLKKRRKGQFQKYNQVGHLHQKFSRYEESFFPVGTTVACQGKGKGGGKGWEKDVRLQPRAMALAGGRLYLAGWLDDVVVTVKSGRPKDPSNPDPHESVLWVCGADDGERSAELALKAEPVFDGLAVAGGRLFLAMKDGTVLCLRP